jgi:hypothetical protein
MLLLRTHKPRPAELPAPHPSPKSKKWSSLCPKITMHKAKAPHDARF